MTFHHLYPLLVACLFPALCPLPLPSHFAKSTHNNHHHKALQPSMLFTHTLFPTHITNLFYTIRTETSRRPGDSSHICTGQFYLKLGSDLIQKDYLILSSMLTCTMHRISHHHMWPTKCQAKSENIFTNLYWHLTSMLFPTTTILPATPPTILILPRNTDWPLGLPRSPFLPFRCRITLIWIADLRADFAWDATLWALQAW